MEKLNNIWWPNQEEPHIDDIEAYKAFWRREKERCMNGFYIADGKVFISGRIYFHTVYWKIAMYVKVNGKKVRKILTPLLRDVDWDIFSDLERCDEEGKFYIIVGSRDFGKALINSSSLYTNNGEILIGDAKVGDEIFGADGKLTTITGVYPQGEVDTYEMTLRDGRRLYCCDEHLWKVWNSNKQKYEVLPLKEIRKDYLGKRKISYKNSKGIEAKYFIPNNAPVEYSENYLPIDPYFLGLWLGDGTKRTLAITTIDIEISDFVREYARQNNLVVTQQGISYGINNGMKGGLRNPLLSKFTELNLLNNKHIPTCYFYSSVEQRMELLRGLMDTDGCCSKNGVIEFCTTDSNIANGFYRLVRSLGISVTIKKVTNNTYKSTKTGVTKAKDKYRFNLMTDRPIFKLQRKLFNIKSYRGDKTSIVDIKPYKKDFATCITVDNEDSCFLTDNYTPTHNSIIAASCIGHQYTFYSNSECVVSGGAASYIKLATNKVEDGLINLHSVFKKQRLVNDWAKEVRAGWKDRATNQANPKSSNSVIFVRNYQEGTDTMAANGTRPSFHLIDEIGTLPNLIGCIKDGDGCWWSGSDEEEEYEGIDKEEGDEEFIRDSSIKPSCLVFLAGTGGDMNKGKEASEVFYDPEAYNLLEFENEWEGGGKIGRFISALRAKMNYKEKRSLSSYLGISHPDLDAITILVSNEERALNEWWQPTYEKNMRSGNSKTILKFKAYWPCKPSDSFIVLTQNDFNVEAAKAQKTKLLAQGVTGNIVKIFNDGEKIIHEFVDQVPITEYPVKSQDTDAPIQIWEFPISSPPFGLYVAGVDPYRHSEAEYSGSLGVVYIYKRMHSITSEAYQNMFVACYAARPQDKTKWNENARNLIKYYNARTLCENDEMGFIDFMIAKGDGHYLEDQPEWLKEYVPNTKVDRKKGIHRSSLTIRNFLDGTFKSYLDEVIEVEKDENGSIIREVLGISKVLDPMLCEEITKFSKATGKDKVNTDRCFLPRQQVLSQKGYKNIEDVTLQDKVLTHTGNYEQVTELFKTEKDSINTTRFRPLGIEDYIECTDNHPFLVAQVIKGKGRNYLKKSKTTQLDWKLAKDLVKTDYVLIPKRKNLVPTEISKDLLYLLGWYLSDGNRTRNNIKITFQGDQLHLAEQARELILKYDSFGKTGWEGYNHLAKRVIKGYRTRELPRIKKVKDKYAYNLDFNSTVFNLLIDKFIEIKSGGEKIIKEDLFNCTNILPLVLGFLEGDGHQKQTFSGVSKKSRETIEVSGTYITLLKQIRQILFDNNIWCTSNLVKPKENRNTQLRLDIQDQVGINKILDSLELPSKKFYKVEGRQQQKLHHIIEEGILVQVKRIEKNTVYNKTVYNLEVENDHSYTVSNIATHNCVAAELAVALAFKLDPIIGAIGEDNNRIKGLYKAIKGKQEGNTIGGWKPSLFQNTRVKTTKQAQLFR